MAETRKKLTSIQAKNLAETQEAVTKARVALMEAEREAQRVLTLIFDAVGLDETTPVRYDEQTQELVVVEPQLEA